MIRPCPGFPHPKQVKKSMGTRSKNITPNTKTNVEKRLKEKRSKNVFNDFVSGAKYIYRERERQRIP